MKTEDNKFRQTLHVFLQNSFNEDIGDGDHTSIATIPKDATGSAKCLIKDSGTIAGISLAKEVFSFYDPSLKFIPILSDGDIVNKGDLAFTVEGRVRSILSCERLVLNCMQRMSGIATRTRHMVQIMEGSGAKLLDTRKTTPGMRFLEKWAVRIGGGHNHRFGLYDMVMIKDNHVDHAGGIKEAIGRVQKYLDQKELDLFVVIEVRSLEEISQVLETGGVNRMLIDNFKPDKLKEAVELIDKRFETEASGGITEVNLRDYAFTGVDFISSGALTQSIQHLDISLKVV